MSKKSYQRYTAEFKEQALGLLRTGKPVAEVASPKRTLCGPCGARMHASWPKMTF
jgi:hypothetical protein